MQPSVLCVPFDVRTTLSTQFSSWYAKLETTSNSSLSKVFFIDNGHNKRERKTTTPDYEGKLSNSVPAQNQKYTFSVSAFNQQHRDCCVEMELDDGKCAWCMRVTKPTLWTWTCWFYCFLHCHWARALQIKSFHASYSQSLNCSCYWHVFAFGWRFRAVCQAFFAIQMCVEEAMTICILASQQLTMNSSKQANFLASTKFSCFNRRSLWLPFAGDFVRVFFIFSLEWMKRRCYEVDKCVRLK